MNVSRSVALSQLRLDGGTQPREAINSATVDEYAEAMRQLVPFPPLVAFHDGVSTWLADGFHRYHAATKIGATALQVDWRVGTIEMAKLYAASANAAHGLRRTAGDKRRAIEMVRSTEEGRTWKQERIAQHCNVARSWVAEVMAKCRTDKPQKNPQSAEPTRAEAKRARIAEATTERPSASNSAIARELGVDRETVAAVRGKAKATPAAPAAVGGPARAPAREPPRGGYSTADAQKAARAALEGMRAARAVITEGDWKLLLAEIGEIR